MRRFIGMLSWGATPGALRLRSRVRLGLACGATALLMVGCLLPHLPRWLGPRVEGATLVDLDEDGRPEQLRLVTPRAGGGAAMLRLASTKQGGHDHPVATLQGAAGATFTGGPPSWALRTPRGVTLLTARLVQQPGRKTPDLLMLAGERAWRWVYLERGFLKLDASEIIPGFSVGLLMVGDRREVVEAIGGPVTPGGTWQAPLTIPMACSLRFDDARRVKRITSSSPRLQLRTGQAVGQPLGPLAAHFPGTREGDAWSSPRYGLSVRVDSREAIVDVAVQRPWQPQERRSR